MVSKVTQLLAEARRTAAFLENLAAHLEGSEMPGQAGNCTIRARALRAAINEVAVPGKQLG